MVFNIVQKSALSLSCELSQQQVLTIDCDDSVALVCVSSILFYRGTATGEGKDKDSPTLRLSSLSTYELKGQCAGDEHPTYVPLEHGPLYLYLTTLDISFVAGAHPGF